MMRFSKASGRIANLIGIVTLTSLSAWGQNSGFYIKGDLGGNITEDIELKEFFGPVTPGSQIKLDPGIRAGVSGGYQVTDWFAAEAELGVLENTINSITDATRIHDASFVNVPLLFNAKFRYPNRTPLAPYIGAGVGFSESIFDVDNVTIGSTSLSGSGSATVFAYQAFAGLRYRLNERMGLSVEYRYFVAESPTWHAEFISGTGSDAMSFGRSQTHAFSLAFDFRF
jgi:opacity protein-like surface antigen